MAREAATADLLTDGRLQVGLGAGHMKSEYDEAGLRFDAGGARVERLAEAVTIVKSLLKGEAVTFAGRYYRVSGHTIHPLPVQRPHPPLLIGGNGRRLLTLAAREADIVGLSGITFRHGGAERDLSGWRTAGVDQRVQLVREVAGHRYERLELNALLQTVVVTDNRRQAAEELARRWTQLSPAEILESPLRPRRHRRPAGRRSSSSEGTVGYLVLRHLRALPGGLRPRGREARGSLGALDHVSGARSR
jgi:probable F420-dependent oxidoreductase